MLPTIPFKRRPAELGKSNKTSPLPKSSNYVHISARKKPLSKSTSRLFNLIFNPWFIVLTILIIVVTGVVVLRISQASVSTTVVVPQNLSSIKNYINSLGGNAVQSKPGTLGGTVIFNYTPNTSNGVATVAFYLDNRLVATKQKAPYQLQLDTQRYTKGNHTLTVVSFNSAGVPTAAIIENVAFENPSGLFQDIQKTLTYPYYRLFQL